jgi:phospholipid-transporting ATPase
MIIHDRDGKKQKEISLSNENVLLRGCHMRNTSRAYGLTIYTGHDTKIMQNSAQAAYKFSDLEIGTNRAILVILSLQLILALLAAGRGSYISLNNITNINEVIKNTLPAPLLYLQLVGTFILILTNFVPLSLIVTLELVKFW